MLEGTSNHLLDKESGQSLETGTLLGGELGQLAEVADVDTTLVQQLSERLAVHGEANVAIMKVLNQVGHDLGPEVLASFPHFLLILGPLLLLLFGLGNLATENIRIERQVESRDVNTILILALLLSLLLSLLL
jgi:hypothetical protein